MSKPALNPIPRRSFDYAPEQGLPKILHEDDCLLIVDKPAGLLSVPGKAEAHKDCLESRIQSAIPAARIVHRLDMATSGVMILAKTPEAHRHLGLQFEKRIVQKTYIAMVDGNLNGQSGRIDMPLICDWPNRPLQKPDWVHGKRAVTDWEILKRGDGLTQLRLYPKTGRSHQLRVHMQAIGHPILGDRLYAPDDVFAAGSRLCLHAHSLRLRHPDGGAWMQWQSDCPF